MVNASQHRQEAVLHLSLKAEAWICCCHWLIGPAGCAALPQVRQAGVGHNAFGFGHNAAGWQ